MWLESQFIVENDAQKFEFINHPYITTCQLDFRIGMETSLPTEVNAKGFGAGKTESICIRPNRDFIDCSLQLSVNESHIVSFTRNVKVVHV